jgi:hypothetical protein
MTNATRSDERNDEDERQDNQVYECPEAAPKTPAPTDRCSNVDTWLLDYFPSDNKSSRMTRSSSEAAWSAECSWNIIPEQIFYAKSTAALIECPSPMGLQFPLPISRVFLLSSQNILLDSKGRFRIAYPDLDTVLVVIRVYMCRYLIPVIIRRNDLGVPPASHGS